ncbi:NAD(P)-binding domain-containing protein [Streptomyces sp. HPF1205]|uniref:lactate/malate family dehydrogenase n=1 Tax=Streptomyces sp. HPF1205 TaxID=2873262 RepID=UPI001CED1BEE|nr:NAD(P)-binding domain-containing protein [Streptomyces sp. HPF1205]
MTSSPAVHSIGVIGAGAVGQAVTGALVVTGLCRDLLIASRTSEQAAALAADLADMCAATGSPVHPRPARSVDMLGCQAVVVAARVSFTNNLSQDVRMGGARANAPAIRGIGAALRGHTGTLLMVTNPVDLMSQLVAETSGCTRVFGIGCSLDTARYRLTLARMLDVPLHAVEGRVIGEHGDAAVVCTSSTTVHGSPLDVPVKQVRDELANRPRRISAGVGRTRTGPAGAVLSALRLALGVEDGTVELSAPYQDGWLGIPLRFTAGRPVPCIPHLDDDEARQLDTAYIKLRAAYQVLRGDQPDPHSTVRTP